MRETYILLKDSPELKKGALIQEECDDGDQDFRCINEPEYKKEKDDDVDILYSRAVVENNPDWFQKVIVVTVSVDEKKKIEKLLKRKLKEYNEEE